MEPHEMAEKLVEKCGITYEEAAEILKQADFDMLEAMIILERQGRLGKKGSYSTGRSYAVMPPEKKQAADADNIKEFFRIAFVKIRELLRDFLKYRLIGEKGSRIVMSIPLIVAVILFFVTNGLAAVALIISILTGINYKVEKTT